jgi:hypothetical protein
MNVPVMQIATVPPLGTERLIISQNRRPRIASLDWMRMALAQETAWLRQGITEFFVDHQTEFMGLPGPQGVKGDPGPVGPSGATGATGAQGVQGQQGLKGDTGPQGAKGVDAEMPRRAVLAYAGADLTWTYPEAFAAGVVPVVEAVAVGPSSGSTASALYNVQVVGDPTNTSCKLRVNTIAAASVNLLGLGTLNLFSQAPTGVKVHVTARAP